MKESLVGAHVERIQAIEAGTQTVVGVNRYKTTAESPLSASDGAIQTVDPAVEAEAIKALQQWRKDRNEGAAQAAITALKEAAANGTNIMEPSIAAAKAGVTTGEWGTALRDVFGEYRGPTGVALVVEPAMTKMCKPCVRALMPSLKSLAGSSPMCWANLALTGTPMVQNRSPAVRVPAA